MAMQYFKFIVYLIITVIYIVWMIKDYRREKKVYKLIALIPIVGGIFLQHPIIDYFNMIEAVIVIWIVVLSLLTSIMLFTKDIAENKK